MIKDPEVWLVTIDLSFLHDLNYKHRNSDVIDYLAAVGIVRTQITMSIYTKYIIYRILNRN